ncbi:secreted RxLR effector protein 161-like [Nicotiana tabacum]|uniref:Secreted RxLR effector protein 161-like n=1 Tax=Nicotiana tabacum TaxID=4097 RepID=A0AC58U5P0_TOBAC
MDNAHPLSTPMVVKSLDINKDPFRPQENDEELVGDNTPYLSAVGLLMYLANNTRPNITFIVSLIARFSSSPTRRHWNGVNHIFRYLRGTLDMRLFYSNEFKSGMIGYADAGYLSDPHKEMCGFLMKKDNPTTLYEYNVSCIAQLKGGYIK